MSLALLHKWALAQEDHTAPVREGETLPALELPHTPCGQDRKALDRASGSSRGLETLRPGPLCRLGPDKLRDGSVLLCQSHRAQRGRVTDQRHLCATHLFPFGTRVPFEAGESWGALRVESWGSESCPAPPSTPARAPWDVTHHGAGGAIGAWGSREALFTLKHSRPCA